MSNFDQGELRQAVAALETILRKGMEQQLKERISEDWRIANQEHLESPIGRRVDLQFTLKKLLKLDPHEAEQAVDWRPCYPRIAFQALLQLAAEINSAGYQGEQRRSAPPIVRRDLPRPRRRLIA